MLWDVIEARLKHGPVLFDHPTDGEWVLWSEDPYWCVWEVLNDSDQAGYVYIETVKKWMNDPDLVLVDWFETDVQKMGGKCICPYDNFRRFGGCVCGGK